jgi:hypothetical protein
MARLELPLFVAASPHTGLLAERLLPAPVQALLCLFLLNWTAPRN